MSVLARSGAAPAAARDRTDPPGPRPRAWGRGTTWSARAAIAVAVLLLWGVLGATDESVAAFVSTPWAVAGQLGGWASGTDAAWDDLLATLRVASAGLAGGAAAAIVIALALTELPAVGRFVGPFVAVANVLPKVALIPLFILWFGIGDTSKVAFVAVSVFFIVFFSVLTRCSQASSAVRDHIRVIGGGRLRLVTQLLLPTAWGAVISSLRLSVAFALFGAVLTEMMAANEGMGYLLANGQATLHPEQVVAAVVVVSVVATVLDAALVALDRRLARWRVR